MGLRDIRYLKTLKKVREWLGLPLSGMASELGVSKSLVVSWQSGHRKITAEAIERIGVMIANKLSADLGRIVGVKIVVNSPWRVTAWTQCARCREWFELQRSRDRSCEKCRTQQEAQRKRKQP